MFEKVGDHWGMGTAAQGIGARGGPDAHEWLRRGERHMDLLGAAQDVDSIRIMLDVRAALDGDEAAAGRLREVTTSVALSPVSSSLSGMALRGTQEMDVALAHLALGQLALLHGDRAGTVQHATRVLAVAEGPGVGFPQARVLFRSAVAVLFLQLADLARSRDLLAAAREEALGEFDIPVLGAWILAGAALADTLRRPEAAELWTIGRRLGGNAELLFPAGTGSLPDVEDIWTWHERPMTEAIDRVRALMSDFLAVRGEG